jgi:hypothetical protein
MNPAIITLPTVVCPACRGTGEPHFPRPVPRRVRLTRRHARREAELCATCRGNGRVLSANPEPEPIPMMLSPLSDDGPTVGNPWRGVRP